MSDLVIEIPLRITISAGSPAPAAAVATTPATQPTAGLERVDIDPNYANAHNNLGKALALRGELEEATLHFRQALRSEPQLGSAHEGLARALALQGKKEEAVEHYQEAIRIFKSQKSSGRDAPDVSANK